MFKADFQDIYQTIFKRVRCYLSEFLEAHLGSLRNLFEKRHRMIERNLKRVGQMTQKKRRTSYV